MSRTKRILVALTLALGLTVGVGASAMADDYGTNGSGPIFCC